MIETVLREFGNWTFRFRPGSGTPSRLMVLLHGWTGDENSMWIFEDKLPDQAAVLAPRGYYIAPEGGYSWVGIRAGMQRLPVMDDFLQVAGMLIAFIDKWSPSVGVSANQIDLVGFSQGAALCYALALLYPERVRVLAALSGFLPVGAKDLLEKRILAGKTVYVTHGRQDKILPLEQARKSVALLERSGARVIYCESGGGHNVSAKCNIGLRDIFGENINSGTIHRS